MEIKVGRPHNFLSKWTSNGGVHSCVGSVNINTEFCDMNTSIYKTFSFSAQSLPFSFNGVTLFKPSWGNTFNQIRRVHWMSLYFFLHFLYLLVPQSLCRNKLGECWCNTMLWVLETPDFLKESHILAVRQRELQSSLSGAFPGCLMT